MKTDITLVKATQTSVACPSQWDAWDTEGKYYYLRYRHGHGTVQHYPGGPEFWERLSEESELVSEFEHGDSLDGSMSLEDFAEHAGITICTEAQVKSFGQYLTEEMAKTFRYPEDKE